MVIRSSVLRRNLKRIPFIRQKPATMLEVATGQALDGVGGLPGKAVKGAGALDWKVERVVTELREKRLLAGIS
jgi:hypothetical protein